MCVPWELNPQAFALLTQCSTTEPQFILHSAYLFRDERWTLLGNQILHRRSGIISIRVTHVTNPHLYKCLQVHVIANSQLVRCVLVRLYIYIYISQHRTTSGSWSITTSGKTLQPSQPYTTLFQNSSTQILRYVQHILTRTVS